METAATGRRLWTILSLLEWSTGALRDRGVADARLNAELLLCRILGCKRIDLYLKFDKMLTDQELAAYKVLFKRRLANEPIQYILGETEFMGLRLSVDTRVFIPRPDTELLVEEARREALERPDDRRKVLDIGTGSGNVAIAMAAGVEGCVVDAIDSSDEALEVARANVTFHNLEHRITLIQADIRGDAISRLRPPYDLVLSNPPYIPEEEFQTLPAEIREHEPQGATRVAGDGLEFYRTIAVRGAQLLRTGGRMIVEIGYNQSETVPEIFRKEGYKSISTVRDYGGHVRVVRATPG